MLEFLQDGAGPGREERDGEEGGRQPMEVDAVLDAEGQPMDVDLQPGDQPASGPGPPIPGTFWVKLGLRFMTFLDICHCSMACTSAL